MARKLDEFDFMSRKVMKAMVATADILDKMKEPFRAGGICALEELYFRICGQHFDWEDFKIARAAHRKQKAKSQREG